MLFEPYDPALLFTTETLLLTALSPNFTLRGINLHDQSGWKHLDSGWTTRKGYNPDCERYGAFGSSGQLSVPSAEQSADGSTGHAHANDYVTARAMTMDTHRQLFLYITDGLPNDDFFWTVISGERTTDQPVFRHEYRRRTPQGQRPCQINDRRPRPFRRQHRG